MNFILVHGILGFGRRLGIDYFRDVAGHFRTAGLRTCVPELDPTKGVEFRAEQLQNQVLAAFSANILDSKEKTHIIAHSMGGLDSRYMLSPANQRRIPAKIESLTTISTPHRGSPIADIIDAPIELLTLPHLPLGSRKSVVESALDTLGISLSGLRDLTTQSCLSFSARYHDDPNVTYLSVAGSGRLSFPETSFVLLKLYRYILATTGQLNDGLVAIGSATWGVFDPITWPADHAEEVGHNLDDLSMSSTFQYLAKYDEIVAKVATL
jgi:triacylglycerol lipase